MMNCPCCGKRTEGFDPAALAVSYGLSNIQARVLERIASGGGGWVDAISIGEHVYADDLDGGPEFITQGIAQHVIRIRKKLAPSGLVIEGKHRCGYRIVGALA